MTEEELSTAAATTESLAEVVDPSKNLNIGQALALGEVCLPLIRGNCELLHRAFATADSGSAPSPAARRLAWANGALVYDLSFQVANLIRSPQSEPPGRFESAERVVTAIAELGREIPWAHHSPRFIGAIRSQALLASKRDDSEGYDHAFEFHSEAQRRLAEAKATAEGEGLLESGREPIDFELAYTEVEEQLHLAESGTSSRKVERLISEWKVAAPDFLDGDPDDLNSQVGVGQQLYVEALQGAQSGERALEMVDLLKNITSQWERAEPRLRRLSTPNWYVNPLVMTSRAYLLSLPLSFARERFGRLPTIPDGDASWDESRRSTRTLAEEYLARVEDPELDDKVDIAYPRNHEVAIAQLRVHYAVLYPGSHLKSSARESSPPCLSLERMTDDTVQELSRWLDDDKSNANAIGSITMPLYLAGIRLVRGQSGYSSWRGSWPRLDRFAGHTAPARRVAERSAEFAQAAGLAEEFVRHLGRN